MPRWGGKNQSSEGAPHDSPGQRPGTTVHPNHGALKGRTNSGKPAGVVIGTHLVNDLESNRWNTYRHVHTEHRASIEEKFRWIGMSER